MRLAAGDPDALDDLYPLGDPLAQDIQGCASELPQERRMQLLMHEHANIFQGSPGKTSLVEHVVDVGDCPPIQ